MRNFKLQISSLVLLFFISSCSRYENCIYHTNVGQAEGTSYRIIYKYTRPLQTSIDSLLLDFENEFSIYKPKSAISLFNEGSRLKATPRMRECIEISSRINRESQGLFDPTLRPLIAMWGFGSDKKLQRPTESQIDSVMRYVGFNKIGMCADTVCRENSHVTLDFNAIAKGYSVDLVGRMFDSLGIQNYLIEIGGEITTKGINAKGKPWTIGIDRPTEGNYLPGADMITKIELDGHRGLATSGNYRKFLNDSISGHITHTIDPRTGRSVSHNLLSATIIAENTALADGYATACMVGGLDWSKKFIADNKLRGYLIYSDNDIMKTWDSSESCGSAEE